jgi:CBS domain-containing protein
MTSGVWLDRLKELIATGAQLVDVLPECEYAEAHLPGAINIPLTVEGERAPIPTAGRLARGDVVTCRLTDRVGDVRERIAGSPYGFALLTTPGGVVLGRLRGSALDRDPDLRAEDVMEAGPSTVRPDTPAAELASRLAERQLRFAIVTTPEGRLLGVARQPDLERA